MTTKPGTKEQQSSQMPLMHCWASRAAPLNSSLLPLPKKPTTPIPNQTKPPYPRSPWSGCDDGERPQGCSCGWGWALQPWAAHAGGGCRAPAAPGNTHRLQAPRGHPARTGPAPGPPVLPAGPCKDQQSRGLSHPSTVSPGQGSAHQALNPQSQKLQW